MRIQSTKKQGSTGSYDPGAAFDATPMPHGSRAIVDPVEHKLSEVLDTPSGADPLPMEGVILSIGCGDVMEDGTRERPEVSVGDRVLFRPGQSQDLWVGGKKHLLVPWKALLAVVA